MAPVLSPILSSPNPHFFSPQSSPTKKILSLSSWLCNLYLLFLTSLPSPPRYSSPLTMDCWSSTSSVCIASPRLPPGGELASPPIFGVSAASQLPPPTILLEPFFIFQLVSLLLPRPIIDHPLLNPRWSFHSQSYFLLLNTK